MLESGQCHITLAFQQHMGLVQCSLRAFAITNHDAGYKQPGVYVSHGGEWSQLEYGLEW